MFSQPYMQIDAGKLQSSKGTGLGLSLSRSIVDLHGGSVGFTSEVDVGSSFFFSVPVDVCLLSLGAAAPSNRSQRSSGSAAGANGEEDDVFRDLITPPQNKRSLPCPRVAIEIETPTSALSASGWHTDSALATQTGTTLLSPPCASSTAGDGGGGGGGGSTTNASFGSSTRPSHPLHLRCKTELFFGSASPSAISPDAFSWHRNGTNMSSSPDAHLAAGMVASSDALPIQNTPPPTKSTIQIGPVASGTAAGDGGSRAGAATSGSVTAAVAQSSSAPPLVRAATIATSGRAVSFTVHRQRSMRMTVHDAAQRGRITVRHESNPSATASPAATAAPSPMAAAGASASLAKPFLSSPAPSSSPSPSSASSPSAAGRPSPFPPVRVLVVEDSAPNRKLLCALLSRLRCAVTAVENGQLCVDLMRPHFHAPPAAAATAAPLPFDIVLMVSATGRQTQADAAAVC